MSSKLSIMHPRKPAEHTNRQKRMYDFLKEQSIGLLSTVTSDNNPHGAVVYYAIDPDFTVHILTKTGTRKYDNMVHNDHVMLTVFEPKHQTTAQITGRAIERTGNDTINKVASAVFSETWHKNGNGLPPIMKLQAGDFTTFLIKPEQIRMAIYARPESGDYSTIFESIESFDLHNTA
jgi:general stress protein 26